MCSRKMYPSGGKKTEYSYTQKILVLVHLFIHIFTTFDKPGNNITEFLYMYDLTYILTRDFRLEKTARCSIGQGKNHEQNICML